MEDFISAEQLEKMRQKAKKQEKIVIALSFVALLFYLWPFYIAFIQYIAMIREKGMSAIFEEKMSTLFIVILVIAAVVLAIGTFVLLWFIIVKHSYDKFNSEFKSKFVLQIIDTIKGFDKLKYVPKSGFTWDDVRNAAAVNCGDKQYYDSEDLLLGEYENVRFKISDVTTYEMVRIKKRKHLEELFSGQMLCLEQFDDRKKSNGHIQIFEKKFMSPMIGWKAEHDIHTEHETFNSRFSVYATDDHNAYYILTPQRMEKIISFADVVNGQVSLVFRDEKLFVAVKRDSMFDANIDKPVAEQTAKITEDAEFIKKAKEILVEQ